MHRLKTNFKAKLTSLVSARAYKSKFSTNSAAATQALNYTAPPTHPDDLAVMIFGSSTDVGKTIISAGLSIAAMRAQRKVCYIKPVQTGQLDEYFIQLYANPRGINDIFVRTLQHWKPAMSPHLAANMDDRFKPLSDQDLLTSLTREMRTFMDFANVADTKKSTKTTSSKPGGTEVKKKKLFSIVETAGGVLSPGPNKTLQADLYRSLRMPIVLVGDARLGGISSTVSAYESLRIRGYTVHAIVLIGIDDPNCSGNAAMLEEHFTSLYRPIPGDNLTPGHATAWSLGSPPKVFRLSPMPQDAQAFLHAWYRANEHSFSAVFHHVHQSIAEEWRAYLEMSEAAGQYVWWPDTAYTAHTAAHTAHAVAHRETAFIESAHGDHYRLFSMETPDRTPDTPPDTTVVGEGRPLLTSTFDATASAWTQAVGHGNSSMSIAIGEAAGRYGHVLFPGTLHPPVAQLSRYLVEKGPGAGWAARVFYSDNESTSLDIALTMALRLHEVRQRKKDMNTETKTKKNLVILTQRNGGNTGIHSRYTGKSVVLDIPTICYRRGHLEVDCSQLLAASGTTPAPTAALPPHSYFRNLGELLDVTTRSTSSLATLYRQDIGHLLQSIRSSDGEIGALVLEPMVLRGGVSGGLSFSDPLYQKILVQACRDSDIPVLFDETAAGMYRLGPVTTGHFLDTTPDIACFGTMLSGGYVPLSVTLASAETFSCFVDEQDAMSGGGGEGGVLRLMGQAYSANPIACTAALEAIRLLEHCPKMSQDSPKMSKDSPNMSQDSPKMSQDRPKMSPDSRRMSQDSRRMCPSFAEEELMDMSKLPGVTSVMGLGSVLAIQLTATGTVVGNTGNISHGNGNGHTGNSIGNTGNNTGNGHPLVMEETCLTKSLDEGMSGKVSEGVSEIMSERVSEVMSGHREDVLYTAFVVSVLRQERVFAHALGNTIYLLTTPFTSDFDQQRLLRVIRRTLTKSFYMKPLPTEGHGNGIGTNGNGNGNNKTIV